MVVLSDENESWVDLQNKVGNELTKFIINEINKNK